MPCYIPSLLMISVLGFSVCEWLQYLAVFFSSLLTKPVLGFPESEWLQFPTGFKHTDDACPWLSRV